MPDTIDRIRALQRQFSLLPEDTVPPVHQPEMLLIGCVDARLNPKNDIGIPEGKALIYRNIAALVSGKADEPEKERLSEVAVLEFAIGVMKVKHLVVMGHTDCGGIRACLAGEGHNEAIHRYLAPLDAARDEVIAQGGNETAQARAMEQAAVRLSVESLKSYSVVREALANGTLTLHGWLINTATKRIAEMDLVTGDFRDMAPDLRDQAFG